MNHVIQNAYFFLLQFNTALDSKCKNNAKTLNSKMNMQSNRPIKRQHQTQKIVLYIIYKTISLVQIHNKKGGKNTDCLSNGIFVKCQNRKIILKFNKIRK